MHGFWKRKLPAFLLALVLVTSLIPAAAAVEPCPDGKHNWGAWVVTLEATCNKEGKQAQYPARTCGITEGRGYLLRPVFTITKRLVILRPCGQDGRS